MLTNLVSKHHIPQNIESVLRFQTQKASQTHFISIQCIERAALSGVWLSALYMVTDIGFNKLFIQHNRLEHDNWICQSDVASITNGQSSNNWGGQ